MRDKEPLKRNCDEECLAIVTNGRMKAFML